MDYQPFFFNPDLHPVLRGSPPSHHFLLQVQKTLGNPESCLHRPHDQPGLREAPSILPLPFGL